VSFSSREPREDCFNQQEEKQRYQSPTCFNFGSRDQIVPLPKCSRLTPWPKDDAISKLTEQRDTIEERKEKKIKNQCDQYFEFRKSRKEHKICKINRGGTKDPLTQDSFASKFDEINEFDERKNYVLKCIKNMEKMGEDIDDDDDDDDDGDNGNNTGISKDDAIAID
jgi:hypothetical protein